MSGKASGKNSWYQTRDESVTSAVNNPNVGNILCDISIKVNIVNNRDIFVVYKISFE
jgi:hypothetical protein